MNIKIDKNVTIQKTYDLNYIPKLIDWLNDYLWRLTRISEDTPILQIPNFPMNPVLPTLPIFPNLPELPMIPKILKIFFNICD